MEKTKKGSATLIALFVSVIIFLGVIAFLTSGFKSDYISGAAILDQAIGGNTPLWLLALLFISLLVFIILIIIYWEFAHTPNRLKRELRKLALNLDKYSTDILKKQYMIVYNLYLKLSSREKQNFYAKITKIREEVEVYMVAEKKIQEGLDKAHMGDINQQRDNYQEVYNNYQKLPKSIKDKYYGEIVRLRERLERGIN